MGRAAEAIKARLKSLWVPPSPESARGASAFYPQQLSCQIPYLWSLLSQYLGEREEGEFVEVGAYDGKSVSNTWGLSTRGWKGILIEPIPSLAEACRRNHEMHDGVRVVECAVGDRDYGHVELQEAGPLTSANASLIREYETVSWAASSVTGSRVTARVRTLDSLLHEHGVEPGFDLLVVDVEGFEKEVFAGFTLESWRPKMLIVELVDTHPDLTVTANSDAFLAEHIIGAGYRIVFKDIINTAFVRFDVWNESHSQGSATEGS